jgi:DNA-binding NarL/FixJ family response regulator
MRRVLIADDHPLFREGLRAALSAIADVEVIGEAVDGADAVERTAELRPDVVVLDLHMPELSGVEACRRIRRGSPEVAVLVLTMVEGDASVAAALRAGAQGYLLKGAERAEIARALDVVGHGGVYLPAALAARVPQLLANGQGEDHPFPQLTPREREVLDLVARGLSNTAIATRLYLSPKTVRNLLSTVLGKLHARDRDGAIRLAQDAGLGADQQRLT